MVARWLFLKGPRIWILTLDSDSETNWNLKGNASPDTSTEGSRAHFAPWQGLLIGSGERLPHFIFLPE